jgi:hypothetical protein
MILIFDPINWEAFVETFVYLIFVEFAQVL